MAAKKVKCKVIRKGLFMKGAELEVGSTVELTEAQIKGFSGKVEAPKPKAKPAKAEEKADDK